jgi:hypothetical protein
VDLDLDMDFGVMFAWHIRAWAQYDVNMDLRT